MAAPDAPPTRIMRPTDHDPRTPFDHEFDGGSDNADVTQQFWGTSPAWADRDPADTRRAAPTARSNDDTTGAIRAIRDGVAAFRPQRMDLRDSTGQVRRTREHGTVRQAAPRRADRRAEASIGDLAAGRFDDPSDDGSFGAASDDVTGAPDIDDRDLVPLSAAESPSRLGLGAVDPLLVRFGALALVGVLLVPVALALRSSDPASDSVLIESPTPTEVVAESQGATGASGAADTGTSSEATSSGGDPAPATDEPAAAAAASSSGVEASAQATGSAAESADAGAPPDDGGQTESDAIDGSAEASPGTSDGAIDDAATVDEPAERVVPECPKTYTASAGDSWFGIADAAGVSPSAVMNENRATGDTVILPGDEICLPAGATVPAPPADPAPDTTDAPTTTAAPTTTTAPTTTNAPAPPASVEEVKALIRATWPAAEHDTAMMIAQRESRFNPRADNNWCCYGVFQIYFEVHKGWLDDFGVYTATDLFDAEKNIAAAYHLYEQAGGWGPWGF